MTSLAVALVLAAALLHASWNVILKTAGDPLGLTVQAIWSSAVVVAPVGAIAWFAAGRPAVDPNSIPLAVASGAIEVAYFLALSTAYRRGAISVVYPIARGTAPALAVLAGFFVLRQHVQTPELLGIGLLLIGMWTVRSPIGSGPAVIPALFTGLTIAIYSTIDSVGVRLDQPWLYGWMMWTATAILMVFALRLPGVVLPDDRPSMRVSALIGLFMIVAYVLVLFAFSLAPLAVVAPLRESAVVLVALWGVWRMRESRMAVRLAGACAILAGIVLVSLNG